MGHLTFLIGGARSGKSTLALQLAQRSGLGVAFIATAPRPGAEPEFEDPEMAERIERHQLERSDRPGDWSTIEESLDVADALRLAAGTFTIVDCLTLWVSNLMWADRTDDEIYALAAAAVKVASTRENPVVAVTNEVGMGVHPDTPLGRRYRDVLGRVNQIWAAAADDALLLVAGRAVRLDDPLQLLENVRPGTVPERTYFPAAEGAR
jgi:adenosylcobinamide kinase / adenosylcobinamide-phosphate guanylyltransferase